MSDLQSFFCFNMVKNILTTDAEECGNTINLVINSESFQNSDSSLLMLRR